MDQWLIAALILVVLCALVAWFEIWRAERESRKAELANLHSGPDDVEKRARRAF